MSITEQLVEMLRALTGSSTLASAVLLGAVLMLALGFAFLGALRLAVATEVADGHHENGRSPVGSDKPVDEPVYQMTGTATTPAVWQRRPDYHTGHRQCEVGLGDEPVGLVFESVTSPRRSYLLGEAYATGDLCDIYLAFSQGGTYLLKTPRVRGNDDLMWKENLVLGRLTRRDFGGLPGPFLPLLVETFRFEERCFSAFAFQDGLAPASSLRADGSLPRGDQLLAWFLSALDGLGQVHQCGWVHGAVLPPHMLLHTVEPRLQLVDWIHAERIGSPLKVVPARYKVWYPPECRLRPPATAATDIYLAAASLVWLAGGDPVNRQIPRRLPEKFRRCLKRCLAERPSRRPSETWEVQHELSALAEAGIGRLHL